MMYGEVVQFLQKMKLVVGLGNPGEDYKNTRHNVGSMVVAELQKTKLPNVALRTSDVFMNASGEFVNSLITKYKLEPKDIYIIHDDLDILLGDFKIQFGKGPKDHNGVKSIDNEIGTDQYWHVRVGIDNRPLDNRPMGEEYVLQNFSDEEWEKLNSIIKNICKKLETLLKVTN